MKTKKSILGLLVAIFSMIGMASVANAIDPIATHDNTSSVEIKEFQSLCSLCGGPDGP